MSKNDEKYLEIVPGQIEISKELAETISLILDDKKAKQIKIIETNKQTIIADYFVIATGTSSTHIRSLADEIEFQLKEKSGLQSSRVSGKDSKDWIIMDYDSVLVHIFNNESRDYYKLEKLWGDGENVNIVNIEDILKLQEE